ncbi:hypothetical protein OE88DRAFT_100299 [Heliocybe sulcata]|uniref:Cora-domain-containing protein n=1 Tax=Heliocybe sulcata TaxID=5364 RepID=A0A5C3NGW1_9AGAM|nr:hypothetical protein OE88DRAFT_100299 [Heliocybe sulcata]
MSVELGDLSSPSSAIHSREHLTVSAALPPVSGKDFAVTLNSPVEEEEDGDIYRGDPPGRPSSPDTHSVISSRSSTSSSSSENSVIGRRLGAIAAVVEHAIARWARGNASISSAASTISSASSVRTLAKSVSRRRRRRPSLASIHENVQSEREIAARLKAREEYRHISREFTLYLPKSLCQSLDAFGVKEKGARRQHPERVTTTTSLPFALHYVDAALKKSTKTHRNRDRSGQTQPRPDHPKDIGYFNLHHDYMVPNSLGPTLRPTSFPDASAPSSAKKGKRREENRLKQPVASPSSGTSVDSRPRSSIPQRAWWIDVASPTWEDMKAFGKLLHIHPLTLEDILQQDPREKLELFPKLGYYFIVFKALESKKVRGPFLHPQAMAAGDTHIHQVEDYVGEVMVYLVVFREGVVSFHFSDISEHTDRVRNKLLALDEDNNISNASSDWIAHGILDSIVDAFFPFQEGLEKEIESIEDVIFSGRHQAVTANPIPEVVATETEGSQDGSEKTLKALEATAQVDEKRPVYATSTRTQFTLPTPTIPLMIRRLRRVLRSKILPKATIASTSESRTAVSSAAMTLRRIMKARRLFTTSTRLLTTKHEVVAQIRKRLLTEGALPKVTGAGDEIEVAMYMGDVQDHILTLQNSLVHYERILVQLHQTYLSQLRLSVSTSKQGIDKAIMILSIVSNAVLCCQVPIVVFLGLFSTNVTIPTNGHYPSYPYNWFYAIIVTMVIVLCLFVYVLRLWWMRAKRKWRVVLQRRADT